VYRLPVITDREKLPVKVTARMEDGMPLPYNIQFDDANATFTISKAKKASTNSIKVCLDDDYAKPNCYLFSIKFENIRVKESEMAVT
jgi:hypothetical protein